MTQPPPLRIGEAQLRLVLVEQALSSGRFEAWESLLDDGEVTRLRRFVVERPRVEFLIGRALLRTSLSSLGPLAPRAWRFIMNAHGRPELSPEQQPDPPIRFNLSHTHGLVALVLSRGREVGVDVEDCGRMTDGLAIADRFFSPLEVQDLHRLPAHRQPDRFFDYWTLKEAYIKARGLGLALPLDQFSFELLSMPPIRIRFGPAIDDDPEAWTFHLFSPTARHRAALALRRTLDAPPRDSPLRLSVWQGIPEGEFRPHRPVNLGTLTEQKN